MKKYTVKTRTSIFWGLVLVGAAVLLILNGIGVSLGYGVSVWRIILGVLCLAWLVDTLAERRFTEIPFPLAFLFLVFETPIAYAAGFEDGNIISDWTVILAALLLTIGLKALFHDREGKLRLSNASSSTIYLDGGDLASAEIRDNLGSVNAYITNRDAYEGGGTVTIKDNLGKVVIHIPANWNVVTDCHDNLGSVSVADQEDGVFDKSITLAIRDNLGAVKVVFD